MHVQAARQTQPGESPQTIHSLNKRLAPFGFQSKYDGLPNNFQNSLCLDNLFERQYKFTPGEGSHYDPKYIDLDPWPLADSPPMPTQQRIQAVTVIQCDGSQAPVTYGIPIGWYATNQQLSDEVRKQCDLPEDKQVVLVLLHNNLFSW